MKEIALHILDIAQNSVNAGAQSIRIEIWEDAKRNSTGFAIRDNGKGMNEDTLKRLNDPFFTTGNKKTGLGIPLLRQHAEAAGGNLRVESLEGEGSLVKADFVMDHIDRQPMGNLIGTLTSLLRSYPKLEWQFGFRYSGKEYLFDTRELKKELDDIALNHPRVVQFIREMLEENLDALSR